MTQDQPDRRRRLLGRPRRALVACALGVASLVLAPGPVSADHVDSVTITPPWGHTVGNDRIAIGGTDLGAATFTQVAAGTNHTIALAADGTLYAWGSNEIGQLGDGNPGTTGSYVRLPVKVDMSGELAGKRIVQIAAGEYHSLALADNGRVYAWGWNAGGRLGLGWEDEFASVPVPTAVIHTGALNGAFVTSIAAGDAHSVALTRDGNVFTWGENEKGQLGVGAGVSRNTPTAVTIGPRITSIAVGGRHTVAVQDGGASVWAWGKGTEGQLGDSSRLDRSTLFSSLSTTADPAGPRKRCRQ